MNEIGMGSVVRVVRCDARIYGRRSGHDTFIGETGRVVDVLDDGRLAVRLGEYVMPYAADQIEKVTETETMPTEEP